LFEYEIARGAAGDERLQELGCLVGERHVARLAALGLPDRQRFDVGVVIGDLEPAELAISAAGEKGCLR